MCKAAETLEHIFDSYCSHVGIRPHYYCYYMQHLLVEEIKKIIEMKIKLCILLVVPNNSCGINALTGHEWL